MLTACNNLADPRRPSLPKPLRRQATSSLQHYPEPQAQDCRLDEHCRDGVDHPEHRLRRRLGVAKGEECRAIEQGRE
jgi:hypothetical protein